MSLVTYKKKRDFSKTAEPSGKKASGNKFRFVVQRHQASRLHYDFRLELGGVLKSWAVPKGPSLNPSQKRLAVMVEDHPVDYISFKGVIPAGNYGAGKVEIWDKGVFQPVDSKRQPITEKQALQQIKKGELKFSLRGTKLTGEFVLVRLKQDDKNWLLIKHKDAAAVNTIYDAEKLVNGLKAKQETKTREEIKVGKDSVIISNRDKIFWPDEGYSKGDLVDYYAAMASYLLPHLKGRPLSLKRNPNGIREEGFYHKDAGEHAPGFVDVCKVKSESSKKTIDYIVCNNKATLLYLANLGCIEINPWNSRSDKKNNPSWMVIDIDPSSRNTFEQVVDVALVTKQILDKGGISSYCKTSGASGLHVYVPFKNKYDYKAVKDFAQIIATLVQEQLPEISTMERTINKRGNRIYIDWLQNRIGQTLASVYSVRPVPGACVSTPLDWKEVNHRLRPSQFTILNIEKRVKKKGEIFLPVLQNSNSIEKALQKLTV